MLSKFFDYSPPDLKLSPPERRWRLKNSKSFFHIPDEFKNIGDSSILIEDSQIEQSKYLLDKSYLAVIAKDPIVEDFSISTLRNHQKEQEYYFILNLYHQKKILYSYEEPVKFVYAGFHWSNEEGFLYCLLKNEGKSSFDPSFKEDCLKYHHYKDEIIPEKKFEYSSTEKSINSFFTFFYKDLHRWIVRYTITFLNDIMKHGGVTFLFPFLEKYFEAADILIIQDLWRNKISSLEIMPPAEEKTKVFSVLNYSPEVEEMINKDDEQIIDLNRTIGGGILCFKAVIDDTPDYIRMNPHPSPYKDGAIYDPPVTRGVTKAEQPLKFIVVNSKIDMEDLDGDTPNMRKIVIQDMLTKSLDYAALNNLPLPPLGTEFYVHIGDSAPKSAIDLKMPMGVYSRINKYSDYLYPFPDYSYQIFSVKTRFHIRASSSLTFDETKAHILKAPQRPLKDREDHIFFRGNDFSPSKIRTFLYQIQVKDFLDKNKKDMLIPKGILKIDIPKLSAGKELPPITVAEMGKYKFLLDLPGYGMWSTRLKFIALTGSNIIRVIFLEKNYDKEKKEWSEVSLDKDLYETFTDAFLNIHDTNTVISNYYSPGGGVNPRDVEELNYHSRLEVLQKIGNMRKDMLKDNTKYEKKAKEILNKVSAVTEDNISCYIYEMMMKIGNYYGYVSDQTYDDMKKSLENNLNDLPSVPSSPSVSDLPDISKLESPTKLSKKTVSKK